MCCSLKTKQSNDVGIEYVKGGIQVATELGFHVTVHHIVY